MTANDVHSTSASLMKKMISKIGATIGTVFAVLGFVNFLSLIDTIESTSKSVQWLVGWWRFFVATFYATVGIRLSELAQTTLTVFAVATGSATAYSLAFHRQTALGFVVKRGLPRTPDDERWWEWRPIEPDTYQPRYFNRTDLPILLAAYAFVIAVTAIVCRESGTIRWIVAWSSIGSLLFWVLYRSGFLFPVLNSVRNRLRIPRRLLLGLLYFWCLPTIVLFVTPFMLAPFRRAVLWTTGGLLLLLAGNWAFAHIVDPLIPALKNLPVAPTAPFPRAA